MVIRLGHALTKFKYLVSIKIKLGSQPPSHHIIVLCFDKCTTTD